MKLNLDSINFEEISKNVEMTTPIILSGDQNIDSIKRIVREMSTKIALEVVKQILEKVEIVE